ncbi:MAG: hypothetical protein ACRDKS_01860 [Actinomycetota bacterium]
MDAEREESRLSRRQLIKRGAVVGGAALWVPPVIQSLRMPAHAQVGSPEPPVECIVDGYMTGKGTVDLAGFSVDYELRKLDCPPLSSAPELKVEWTDGGVDYFFELFTFTSRLCTDDPGIPNGANANFDTVTGSGNGTLTVDGVPESASVSFQFIDAGEGNNSLDSASLTITGVNSGQVLSFAGEIIDKGNQQAHDGNFAFGEACLR